MRAVSLHKATVLGVIFFLFAGAVVLVADTAVAEDPHGVEWSRQFGTPGSDLANDVAVDTTGVYLAGHTSGALPGQVSAGSDDGFVRKYDASGDEVWTRQFGTEGEDSISGVAVDSTGVYVTGDVVGVLPGQTGAGGRDVFVRKYDTAGTELWTRQFGTTKSEQSYGVAVDGFGVYLTGRTWGVLPGQVGAGSSDVFVRKYDTAGTELWTRQYGTGGSDGGHSIAADATGVFVAGWTRGVFPGQTGAGGYDVIVRKYDTAGSEQWTRQFGSGVEDLGLSVAVDTTGVYVTGGTDGVLAGQTRAGRRDVFVRKYDKAGSEQWTRQYGTGGSDEGRGVAVDTTGVYVTGTTGGVLPGQTGAGRQDVFVRKYDTAGSEQWTRQYGTTSTDYGGDGDGVAILGPELYTTGSTRGALPDQINAGDFDALLHKFVANGCGGWAVTIEGTDAAETLAGTPGVDVIHGRGGDDTLLGGGGDDVICGGDGDDYLGGGAGNDTLLGQGGRDILRGWVGDDLLYGGSHSDRVNGGDGSDIVNSGGGNQNRLWGGAGHDRISANNGDDQLIGGAGNDTLRGKAGDDTLDGGDGTDKLNGGPDDDTCTRGEIYESCEMIL